jgi:O-antigen ligase
LVAATVLSGVIVATVDLRELWKVGLLGRMAIWQGSLAMIREHWLFGVGLGRFWEHFPSYRVTSYYTRYPHNFLLEVFAELGIVGGAAVVGFLVAAMAAPVRSIARLRSEPARDASWPLLAPTVASVVLIAHALLDIDWHAPANPILLFVLLGFAQHLPLWTKP